MLVNSDLFVCLSPSRVVFSLMKQSQNSPYAGRQHKKRVPGRNCLSFGPLARQVFAFSGQRQLPFQSAVRNPWMNFFGTAQKLVFLSSAAPAVLSRAKFSPDNKFISDDQRWTQKKIHAFQYQFLLNSSRSYLHGSCWCVFVIVFCSWKNVQKIRHRFNRLRLWDN